MQFPRYNQFLSMCDVQQKTKLLQCKRMYYFFNEKKITKNNAKEEISFTRIKEINNNKEYFLLFRFAEI